MSVGQSGSLTAEVEGTLEVLLPVFAAGLSTPRYLESLREHAVPLDPEHLFALSDSAMALDIYAWLAQRLRRISKTKPQFVPWDALHVQFGFGYARLVDFRKQFKARLSRVLGQYLDANVKAKIKTKACQE